ncbi:MULTISPECIES: acyl-CoA thioesterase [Deinococcus]|uniref:Acyl-CoA thioester hydrolase n=1 Tax=Deinococcus enclensis TaxID=1049582 RepID=A0ABT9MHE4_9DEIO|nr:MULTISPECIES: thioesterase family protein [Deinococcus]MDP9766000.1 acyl-CoA thioester hydrolase [Deinococcus enclensis]GHF79454.1 thioesterase [Deinococcus ficus]
MSETSAPPAAPDRTRMPDLNWSDAHRAQLQMRYSDIDTNHHVNNGRYGEYLENARIQLMHDVGLWGEGERAVLARMEMDYVQEIRWGQALVVESLIEKIGRSSWTVVARILADGMPCAFARTVIVRVNAEHRPEPIPDGVREALRPLMVRG